MGRALMRAALALTPAVLIARYAAHADGSVIFVLAAAALAPLAFAIGEATENLSFHTGPTVGALVNASLGNAPELIIALFAVRDGIPDVVRGSITGSVVSTLLLVGGGAMLVGGAGDIDRRSQLPQLVAIVAALALFLVAAIPGLHGNPERHGLYLLSLPVAVVVLCLYLVVTAVNLRRPADRRKPPPGAWSRRRALTTLAAAAVATAVVSELLVGSLQSFGSSLGVSQFFVAVVVVALVGNAAEQGGAIVVARRGNPGLGTEIAIASATQIAVFVCPVVVLLSGLVGRGLPLSFGSVELAAMAAAALAVGAAIVDRRSAHIDGLLLVACYGGVVAVFAIAGAG